MSKLTIKYGNSNSGYARATAIVGPRGGVSITSHDGQRRRVTLDALTEAVRAHLAGERPSIITTAGDSLSAIIDAA